MPLIEPGKKALAFSLRDQNGTTHALKDYRGAPLVLYFYPKDATSGCTRQACQFRDALSEFEQLGCAVLGVSPQDVKSKAKFAEKESLTFPILADNDAKVCDKYGVWQEKSMYGNTYMGVVRTTYLIGPDGTVVERWDKVRVPGHAKNILEAVRELAASATP